MWLKHFIFLSVFTLPLVNSSCEMLNKSHFTVAKPIGERQDLQICSPGAHSCCSRETEEEMIRKAEKVFRSQLQDKVIILRHMLHTHLNSFKTYFYNSINTCHTYLDVMFKQTYGPFYEQNSKFFDVFFNRLRAFSSPYSEATVPTITNDMFAELFRVVFSLLNPLHTVTDAQAKCMADAMEDIQPFGDLPNKVTTHLEKSLTIWRQFVTAIENTHTILDGFMNASISEECVSNLVHMGDCSMCSATARHPVKPCNGLCMNVMKGCLAEWTEIDQQWNSVVGSLQKLSLHLKGSLNVQNALNPLPVQISEAIMNFQEKGSGITNKVIAKCYHNTDSYSKMTRSKRAVWLRSVDQQREGNSRVLNQLMNTFSDRLSSLRGWFRRLPESFCSDDVVAAKDGDKCWNGSTVAAYVKRQVGFAVAQQTYNPEFQKGRNVEFKGLFVEERLKFGMLSFRLNNILYGRNYSQVDMEGNSADSSDDEDYNEASGDEISAEKVETASVVKVAQPSSPDKLRQSPRIASSKCSIFGFSGLFLLILTRLLL